MHVGGVEVVLLVPGRGRQHDIRVKRRGVHAEVDIDHQVELALGRVLMPLDLLDELFGGLGRNRVGVGPQVMFEEIFMPLGARHQGVAAPDDPQARPVFGRIGVFNGKLHCLVGQLLNRPGDDLLIVFGSGGFGLLDRFDRAAVELRVKGEPAVAHRAHLMIHGVPAGDLALLGDRVDARLVRSALVAPLVGVHIMVGGRVLKTRRLTPVERPHNRRPGRGRGQFLLADVMVEAAAVLADTATEHQGRDAGAVNQVGVIPVVGTGADDDRTFAAGLLGGGGPFARELDDVGAVDTGIFLLPGRGVDVVFGIVICRISSCQPTLDAELRHQQIEDRGHRDLAMGGCEVTHRYPALNRLIGGEIIEGDLQHRVVIVQQRERGREIRAVLAILHLQVPLTFLLLPAETEAAERHARPLAGFIPDQILEVAVLFFAVALQFTGAGHAPGAVDAIFLLQFDQKGGVGVTLEVIEEKGCLGLMVEFTEDDVIDRHPEGTVLPGMGRNPPVGVLGGDVEVGGEDRDLGAVVACFGQKMRIRGTGHVGIGADHGDIFAVVPVGALGNVGLLAPDLG